MEKISTIKEIKYVKGWEGKEETLYFHEIKMSNGDKGKIEANPEESPVWLVADRTIRYSIREGKKGMLIKYLGMVSDNPQTETSSVQPPQRKNNSHSSENKVPNYSKSDSDPAFKLRQQKCISLTTCLDRANELVIAGKIELTEKEKNAMSDFKFIMKHSGIEDMEKELSSAKGEATANSSVQPSEAKKEQQSHPELFQDEPISEFLKEAISRCDTPKQLITLRGQLKEDEATNKNVLTAIHNREQELKKKK